MFEVEYEVTGFSYEDIDQSDIDQDNLGDACDLDIDGDGVLNLSDFYPLIGLGTLADTDGDGRPDECDGDCISLGMVSDVDDDNDGILDVFDPDHPSNLDTDGDGINDIIIARLQQTIRRGLGEKNLLSGHCTLRRNLFDTLGQHSCLRATDIAIERMDLPVHVTKADFIHVDQRERANPRARKCFDHP